MKSHLDTPPDSVTDCLALLRSIVSKGTARRRCPGFPGLGLQINPSPA